MYNFYIWICFNLLHLVQKRQICNGLTVQYSAVSINGFFLQWQQQNVFPLRYCVSLVERTVVYDHSK